MKNIVVLGAPGSGKGTFATEICPQLAIKHVSTGDLLRDVVASGSELGKNINEYITKGELVPDQLIGDMIKDVMKSKEAENGVMLDGFPRTVPQAEMLDKIMNECSSKIEVVLYLNIDLEVIIKRLEGRISCKQCGKPYHKVNIPPKQEGICDVCDGELIQREDDKEETIRKRYNTYLEKTAPLIDYYKNQGLLKEISSTKVDEMVAEVMPL